MITVSHICRSRVATSIILSLSLSTVAIADLSLSPVLSDHAVLQRDMPAPIWGRATPGSVVEVRFADQKVAGKADSSGAWSIELAPLAASSAPRDLVITAGDDRITLHDVLVGEVWLCGGQSNMEWSMGATRDFDTARAEAATGKRSNIRALKMPHTQAEQPIGRNEARWRVTDGESIGAITGVGYHFATTLSDTLDVPVGILDINWGGTRIEPWMQGGAMNQGMIAPVAPFAIRGAIWYQGESNAGEADKYAAQLTELIAAWRATFRRPEMPFGIVQLASFMETSDDPAQGGWSALRQAQASVAATVPHCGLAVILDVGDAKDIHPRDKKTVGARLAAWALGDAYGQKLAATSGPVFTSLESVKSSDGKSGLRAKFSHAEGLRARSGDRVAGFGIAGADGKFVWVEGIVDPRDPTAILLVSDTVSDPTDLVYAWQNNPERANLVNGAGWPAGPFNATLKKQ